MLRSLLDLHSGVKKYKKARDKKDRERQNRRFDGFELMQSRKSQFMSPHSSAVDLLEKLGLGDSWEALNEATGAVTVTDLADFDLCSDSILMTEVGLSQQEIRAVRKATAMVMKPQGEGSKKEPLAAPQGGAVGEEARSSSGGGGGGGWRDAMPMRLPTKLQQQRMNAGSQQHEPSSGLELHSIDGLREISSPLGESVEGSAAAAGNVTRVKRVGFVDAGGDDESEEGQINPLTSMQNSPYDTDL